MAIVGGFDIHRRQVTFDYLDTVSGQVRTGRRPTDVLPPPCTVRAGRPRQTGAATPQRDHPIDHHVAETTAVSRTEVRPGARATRTRRSPSFSRRNP